MTKSIMFSVSVLLFTLLSVSVNAHSYLLKPLAANNAFNPKGCRGRACKGCPQMFAHPNRMNNSVANPQATWSRGQRLTIRWAKNNHVGGFVRLSFVPIDKTMDPAAHERLSFYYGCWEQGQHRCSQKQDCAADETNSALSRRITIPQYLPDGVYVFGFLWFGGVNFEGTSSQFSDYPSCSYVRIRGGKRLLRNNEKYVPWFSAGPLRNFNKRKSCLTYTEKPRACTKAAPGCRGKPVFKGIPAIFKNGKNPPAIVRNYYTNPSSIPKTLLF